MTGGWRMWGRRGVAHTCRRLACVRLLRIADDAIVARRSQTSQDDVCATPGKLKEKSERRKSRRVSGKRDSALVSWFRVKKLPGWWFVVSAGRPICA